MSMELVIITCADDIELCSYQLQTIDRFLEPCTINVVINEPDISLYKDIIEKQTRVMGKHKVKIWGESQIIKVRDANFINGWISQQLLKLLIPLDSDYIVLDCKDMFIRKTKLVDLMKKQRRRQKDPIHDKTWSKFFLRANDILYRYYRIRFDRAKIRDIQTPRLMKQSVLQEITKIWGSKKDFIYWWSNFGLPSEFILYDSIKISIGQNEPDSKKFFYGKEEIIGIWNMNILKHIDLYKLPKDARIVKIHRRIYNDPKGNKKFKAWINYVLQS